MNQRDWNMLAIGAVVNCVIVWAVVLIINLLK